MWGVRRSTGSLGSSQRLCLPSGPDTPENASCSRVDTRSTLPVITPGCGAVGGSVHYVRLPSGSEKMVTPWIKGCHFSRPICGPSPVSFFLSVANIFWNPFLRCIYLSLFHSCFVSLHFWGISKASDKSELIPISQWYSMHAALLLNSVSFYTFRIWSLIGDDNCQYVLHFIHHFLFYWWFPMARLSSLIYTLLFTFPFNSFPFGITLKFQCQDWCTGTNYPFHSRS